MDHPAGEIIPLLLAGGRGTRIAHLYPDLPKPAVPVAGRPFLAWLLNQLSKAGFSRAVVSSGHLAAKLESETAPWIPDGMSVTWIEESAPLGTGGGAIHTALHSAIAPAHWLIMNGDSYLAGDWPERLIQVAPAEMAIVAREMNDTGRYGRLMAGPGDRLLSFSEKTESGPGLINAGIYRIPGAWLRDLPSDQYVSMEVNLIPAWLRQGRGIRLIRSTASFLDVGTPESLLAAEEFIRLNVSP
jgi:D-glycero-alpha-D-manno-heptose 1-phosphate guanylyltransferase